VDDATYVQELFDILTRPLDPDEPLDHYGTGRDGIDRYDGFGRDVRVTSARVVPGEHTPMLELGFVLDLPDDPALAGVPDTGSFRLPVDAEWRRLSGYDDPAAYAPRVAREVARKVHEHVRAHQAPEPTSGELPSSDEMQRLLLAGLTREGTVRQVAPGRFEVVGTWDPSSVVTVLVTPEQWKRVVARQRVDVAPDDFFADLLGPLDPGTHPFVVFWEDDLVASSRKELPPVDPPVETRFVPGGAWFAYDSDGSRHGMDELPPDPGAPER
jgi:hypothetical protein